MGLPCLIDELLWAVASCRFGLLAFQVSDQVYGLYVSNCMYLTKSVEILRPCFPVFLPEVALKALAAPPPCAAHERAGLMRIILKVTCLPERQGKLETFVRISSCHAF